MKLLISGMQKFQNKYRTDSNRLKGWDYRTPAWYFVTICTKNRQHFFGEIRNGIMGLSETGSIAYQNWAEIPEHFDHVVLDEFIVMPNHIHGLIGIKNLPDVQNNESVEARHAETRRNAPLQVGQTFKNEFGPLKPGSLSVILGSYKSSVTRWTRKNNIVFQWQSRFHDHIVRDEKSLNRIRNYIFCNPLRWRDDCYFTGID